MTNGRQLFIDGDARLKVSRGFRDVLASIATDLGGADRLSEGQKQIARRCAMLSVECEIMESAAVAGQPFDLDVYGQLTDRLGRAFQQLGLKRVMHDVTPDLGAYRPLLPQTASARSPPSIRQPQPKRSPGGSEEPKLRAIEHAVRVCRARTGLAAEVRNSWCWPPQNRAERHDPSPSA